MKTLALRIKKFLFQRFFKNPKSFEVKRQFPTCTIDSIEFTAYGLIKVLGWTISEGSLPSISLMINNRSLQTNEYHRVARHDVSSIFNLTDYNCGFEAEFLLEKALHNNIVKLMLDNSPIWEETISHEFVIPDYSSLFSTTATLHRDNIYSYGPPNSILSDDVLNVIFNSIEKDNVVLDLGCGNGTLVQLIRNKGIESYGIEIDRDDIRKSIRPDVRSYITLYKGGNKLPYADLQFDVVIASEVLEHITEFEKIVKEVHRISKKIFVLTVPDISSIPRMHRFRIVPWHLLESTHYNFFTENSLRKLLSPFWKNLNFIKIGDMYINGDIIKNNIAVVCTNKLERNR